jgi:FkbM family methyltransferase
MTRSLVVKRRLPARFGRTPMLVTPDSALQYMKRDLSKTFGELFAIVDEFVQPGSAVWDIGANIGVLAMPAAYRAGKTGEVLALEADPLLASILQRSALLPQNATLNLHVLCAAAADKQGIARFNIAENGRSSNALEVAGGRSVTGGVRYVQHVPTLSLDNLLDEFRAPALVKIDVEGAEGIVLRHAPRLLSEVRPVVYCEVGKPQSDEVAAIFAEHNYRLYNGDLPAAKRVQLDTCAFNTLAIPG